MKSLYKKSVLPDGLKIISESIPTVRSISIGFWVDIGSRDEPDGLEGISHFIEHMVFKGTTSRSSFDIVSYIESVGGVLNAFTTRENTCFLAKIIDKQLPRAVEIIADMIFNPRLDENDLVKEKKIIIDEINEVMDTPADLVHDLFALSIFRQHPLGKPILGTTKTVSNLTREKVSSFLKCNYLRKRIIIVASGNLKHENLVKLVKKYLPETRIPNRNIYKDYKKIKRVKPLLMSGVNVSSRQTNQTHVCIGMPALKFNNIKRTALLLLNSIIGGGMSSRLFQRIREEMGLAYTVFSYLDFFEDTGVIGVYLNTEKTHTGTVISAVFSELQKLKEKKLDSLELDSIREHLKGSLVLGLENTSHRMNRLAKHELLLKRYITIDDTIAEIDKVTPSDIRNIANRLFSPEKVAVTVLGPVKRKPIENSINW